MDFPIPVVSSWDADNLCRACFKVLNATKEAEARASVNMLKMPGLLNKLSACISSIFITTNRGSKYLCVACVERVNEFYEFREMCLQSIRRFEETQYNEESIKSEETNEISFSSESVIKEEYELHVQALASNTGTTSIILPENKLSDIFEDSIEYVNSATKSIQKLKQQDTGQGKTKFPEETKIKSIKRERATQAFEYEFKPLTGLEQDVNAVNEHVSDEDHKELKINAAALNENIASQHRNNSVQMSVDFLETVVRVNNEPISNEGEVELHLENTRKTSSSSNVPNDFQENVGGEHESATRSDVKVANFAASKTTRKPAKDKIEEKNTYNCDKCQKLFRKKRMFKAHIWKHHDLKPYACANQGCGKSFSWPETLKKHRNKHENDEYDLKCYHCTYEGCGKSFSRLYSLRRHQRIHEQKSVGGHKPYHCTYEGCYKSFWSRDGLKKHQRKNEKNNNHFKCNQKLYTCMHEGCNKSFSTPRRLLEHQSCHEDPIGEPRAYQCTYESCDKSFMWPHALKRHQSLHENWNSERDLKPYHCTQAGCDKSFTWPHTLKRHQSYHGNPNGENDLKPYHCTHAGCNKSFSLPRALIRHRKRHEDPKFE